MHANLKQDPCVIPVLTVGKPNYFYCAASVHVYSCIFDKYVELPTVKKIINKATFYTLDLTSGIYFHTSHEIQQTKVGISKVRLLQFCCSIVLFPFPCFYSF